MIKILPQLPNSEQKTSGLCLRILTVANEGTGTRSEECLQQDPRGVCQSKFTGPCCSRAFEGHYTITYLSNICKVVKHDDSGLWH